VAAIRALLLMAALVSPALAQTSFTDGAALATRAVDAAKELRTHLAELAKAGARPDFSTARLGIVRPHLRHERIGRAAAARAE